VGWEWLAFSHIVLLQRRRCSTLAGKKDVVQIAWDYEMVVILLMRRVVVLIAIEDRVQDVWWRR